MVDLSIIIPTYNSRKYIKKSLDSILPLTLKKEIIVVDDGSDDQTRKIVRTFIDNTIEKIILVEQANMNASVARNRGLEIATGKYVLFLDSDDIIFPDSVVKMVLRMQKDNSDLVIGNYSLFDVYGVEIEEADDNSKENYIEYNPMNLVNRTPNPTNKLFKMNIIREKKVYWGNVKIGQDLNFFLKYLLCCKTVSISDETVYSWYMVKESISHKMDLHILDIVNSLKNVENFYKKEDRLLEYQKFIKWIEFEHYHRQMEKQKMFSDLLTRKLIVEYFGFFIKKIKFKDLKKNNFFEYRRFFSCKMKLYFKYIYISKMYVYLRKILKKIR